MIFIFFLIFLIIQFFIRLRIVKAYEKLKSKKVQFDLRKILSSTEEKQKILRNYPESKEEINTFINYLRYSIGLVVVLLIIVIISLVNYYL